MTYRELYDYLVAIGYTDAEAKDRAFQRTLEAWA